MEAIQGPLWEGVLPSVLRRLYVGRKTGRLSFQRGLESHGVRFRCGHIVNADTNVQQDRMGELLVRGGALSQIQLKEALDRSHREGKRLGAVFVEQGLLDAQGLEEAVAAHVRHVLGKVFSWSEGTYGFAAESPEEQPGDVTLRLSTGDLILQAARSVQDPDVVRYNLGDLERRLVLSNDPLLRFQRINLSPVDGYVLSRVDGSLTAYQVGQLIPLPAEQVQRSLFGLLSTGVIDFLPAPPRQAAGPAPEARTADEPRAPSPGEARGLGPLSPPTAEAPGPPPPVDTRRPEVLEAHAGLGASPFEVLGVPRDATEAQVREAYFRLAKRFHPDVHHDPALSDLREQLEQIFGRLNEAYAELSRLRERYEGGPGAKQDA
jgi:hypothetical protein